jgi:hypothetical protein
MASPRIGFRAVAPLDRLIENRRDYPDIRNDALAAEPEGPIGLVTPGAVAARDLYVYYQLLAAELQHAARELSRAQVMLIVEAMQGVALDPLWIANAATILAEDLLELSHDGLNGTSADYKELSALVAQWPATRALAVVEAAVAAWKRHARDDQPLDDALTAVGLLRARRAR